MFNLLSFIETAGYLGVGSFIFAESGLLLGFFLPGDSLLFTAGLLASQGHLNIFILILISFGAAVVGDSVGYAIGRKAGPLVFNKEASLFFNPRHVVRAEAFFNKHGNSALILARFVPIVRTFIPTMAGVADMNYRRFLTYNILGGALWTLLLTLAGFYLGLKVANIDEYLLPIVLLMIILSLIPVWREFRAKP